MRGGPTRIYVAGHKGLVGSAITRHLENIHGAEIITRERRELDLTDAGAVASFFEAEKPELVFLAAAKVGGISANAHAPADFIRENLAIQLNVIHAAFENAVERLLFLGSSCIYPRDCPQPMRESALLTGPLEPTNSAYAVAKIAGIEMCRAYNRQHRTRFLCAMPTNLYGRGDNYELETCHVLPALVRKTHEAISTAEDRSVTVWGDGTPRREFLSSDDLAEACVFLMDLPDARFDALLTGASSALINIGSGVEVTIKELAETVVEVIGGGAKLKWDTSKPNGAPRKLLDCSRMLELGWKPRATLREGIANAYQDFLDRYAS